MRRAVRSRWRFCLDEYPSPLYDGDVCRVYHGTALQGPERVGDDLQALALANALGMRPLQAHCHRGLGTLYAALGQRQQAHTELATAIELYQAMEMTFWLSQTEAALAQVEG